MQPDSRVSNVKLKNTCHFKERMAPFFYATFEPSKFPGSKCRHAANRETLHFLIRKNFCGVNLGLDGEGIAMSGSIGQAMHYTVTFSQCLAFEIYKRLSVFSERITVRGVDACRHPVPVVSLNTKKKRFSLKYIVCQSCSTSLFSTACILLQAKFTCIWFTVSKR